MDELTSRFLNAFNDIEKLLIPLSGQEGYTSFVDLVRRGAQRSKAVRDYERDLRGFADLRNAIVHHHRHGQPPTARLCCIPQVQPFRTLCAPTDAALIRSALIHTGIAI